MRGALVFALALAGCDSCNKKDTTQAGPERGMHPPGLSSEQKLPPLPPGGAWPTPEMLSHPSPSFRNNIAPVLERMCAKTRECHGREPTTSVSLDLQMRDSWKQLVNAPAEGRKGSVRVKPGDPDGSFLVDKLRGRLSHGEGKRMPIDANTGAPIEPSPIDQQYLDAILIPWIQGGAPKN
jgi:hypothetical protein